MPHRDARWKLIVLFAAIGVAACHSRVSPPAGDVAASLTLPTLTGATFDPSLLHGKPAIVTFWRPGCPYCANALPKDLRAARDTGASAVAITIAGGPTRAAEELDKLRWSGFALVADQKTLDRYGIPHVPYSFVLRPDGTAARVIDGDELDEDDIAAALRDAR